MLNGDERLYGPHHILEASESCWNSEGETHHSLTFTFLEPRAKVGFLELVFQEGFVGQDMRLETDEVGSLNFNLVECFQPKDSNDSQLFVLSRPFLFESKARLSFTGSTDLFGRIIIYTAKWLSPKV